MDISSLFVCCMLVKIDWISLEIGNLFFVDATEKKWYSFILSKKRQIFLFMCYVAFAMKMRLLLKQQWKFPIDQYMRYIDSKIYQGFFPETFSNGVRNERCCWFWLSSLKQKWRKCVVYSSSYPHWSVSTQ